MESETSDGVRVSKRRKGHSQAKASRQYLKGNYDRVVESLLGVCVLCLQ